MQASSQNPVRADATIVLKFRDAEHFTRATGFLSAKTHPEQQVESF